MPIDPSASASRAAALPLWSGPVAPEPLPGGLSNTNFVVRDGDARYVVRVGDDLPVHHVDREREVRVSRAAARAGLSPEVAYAAPGVLVLRYIEGARPLTGPDLQDRATLSRVASLVRRCHGEVQRHMRGAAPFFWVFHVLRDYAATLRDGRSRFLPELPRLLDIAAVLETALGPVEIAFCHNDLLPANLIDDGDRLWLIDWEYGGYGSPLFDLGGLGSNGGLEAEGEELLLETYFERSPDDGLRRRYAAARCASLLREAMWGMVSELHLTLPIDYVAYARDNLARFERAWTDFTSHWEYS
jgi:thiamine kinase-like enzyme